MLEKEITVITSSNVHTKEPTTLNTINSENDLKMAEQTLYTWQRREEHTEKGKGAEPLSIKVQALTPSQPSSGR